MSTPYKKRSIGFLSDMKRYPGDGWLAGVCRGIADYFDWEVKVVRVIVIGILILTAFWPVALVYAVLWYVMNEGDLTAPVRPKWSDMPLQAAQAAQAAAAPPAREPEASMQDIKERFTRLDERLRRVEEAALNKDEALRREIDRLASSGKPGA